MSCADEDVKAHAQVEYDSVSDVISKNFSIVDVDNAQICNHIKRPLGCELEIADAQNELICLMTALCVNMITSERYRLYNLCADSSHR